MIRDREPGDREPGHLAPVPAGAVVLIGLGGNLGDDQAIRERFDAARAALATRLAAGPVATSRIYRSDPAGPITDQPRFLNAAVRFALARATPPAALLAGILAIETELGRVRDPALAQGPRTIDLDLLFAGGREIDSPELTLPHPDIAERAFVLRPLADLMGADWRMPGFDRTVAECLRGAPGVAVPVTRGSPGPGSAERYSTGA